MQSGTFNGVLAWRGTHTDTLTLRCHDSQSVLLNSIIRHFYKKEGHYGKSTGFPTSALSYKYHCRPHQSIIGTHFHFTRLSLRPIVVENLDTAAVFHARASFAKVPFQYLT